MKKLLLINPYYKDMSETYKKSHNKEQKNIKYGLLSIASYVQAYMKDEIEVKLLDCDSRKFDDFSIEECKEYIRNYIRDFSPEIIGISSMFNFLLDSTIELLNLCKDEKPEAFVFAGGPCAMAYAKKILEESNCDAISFYEGEKPILELCKKDDYIKAAEEGKAWQTLKKVQQGFTPVPDEIEDLDEIPAIKFHLLDDLEQYMCEASLNNIEHVEYRSLPIYTSRGCPFNCVFCASHFVHGKKMRKMSADRVIADVKQMVEQYGINHLLIGDDQFLLDLERAKKILRGIAPLNLKVDSQCGLSTFLLDEELAELLKNAGFEVVALPVESGSEYTLKHIIDKPVDLGKVEDMVKSLRDQDLRVHASIVMGLPGETADYREESRAFLRKAAFDWYNIFCATPLKGSRLYDICIEKGYLEENFETKEGFHKSYLSTEDFTADEITREVYLTNLELNFVNNYNMRSGNYEIARGYFEYVVSKFDFHAIAHYCLAQCHKALGNEEAARVEYNKFRDIIEKDMEWKGYAEHFGLMEKEVI